MHIIHFHCIVYLTTIAKLWMNWKREQTTRICKKLHIRCTIRIGHHKRPNKSEYQIKKNEQQTGEKRSTINTEAYNKNKLYLRRHHVLRIKQPTNYNYNYCFTSFEQEYYMGATDSYSWYTLETTGYKTNNFQPFRTYIYYIKNDKTKTKSQENQRYNRNTQQTRERDCIHRESCVH